MKKCDKIALNKSVQKYWYFSYFSMKTYCGYSLEAPLRGASNEYPQHMFSWRNKTKYYLDTPLIDLELLISTRKRAKLRVNIFSISRLVIDDQSVLHNRWSIMKFWPIPNTSFETVSSLGQTLLVEPSVCLLHSGARALIDSANPTSD